MKKVTALILAIFMVFNFTCMVFAEEEPPIQGEDIEEYVNQFDSMTCIMSVEKKPNGYGKMRIEVGNKAYIDSFENVKQFMGDKDRGKHRGGDADTEGQRKAAHRTCAESIQDDRRDNRRHVGVDDCGHRVREALAYGGLKRPSRVLFFADSLEDHDVGVDGHADAEHDTGHARQRQLRAGEREQQHDDQHINRQRDVRHDAAEAIPEEHEQHDEDDTDDAIANPDKTWGNQ